MITNYLLPSKYLIVWIMEWVYSVLLKPFLQRHALLSKRRIAEILFVIALFSYKANATTYYSYQSGDWSTANTWTTDPSGTTLVAPLVPVSTDNVVILNGRTVTLTAAVATTGHDININSGGILNLSTSTITTLDVLEGSGTLRIGASYFPTVTSNTFLTTDGSTVEYYDWAGSANLPTTPTTYYNLTLSHSLASARNMTLASNLTVSGDFIMSNTDPGGSLTFTIGNSTTVRTLTFNGDVTVGTLCTMTVGAFNTTPTDWHLISMAGDFLINGTVDLTRAADYDATPTAGAAQLTFTGATDNAVTINGSASFHNFIVNKGTDQTYILDVICSVPGTDPFDGNLSNDMVTLSAGTLKLGTNLSITRLNSAGQNYDISTNQDVNAGLWIDGATVTLGGSALVVYGKFRISSGSLTISNGQACTVTRGPGDILIEGGTVTMYTLRVSSATLGTGSYTQTGGTVNISGTAVASGYPAFCWPYPESTFIMSGGTLNVSNPGANVAAANGGILIGSCSYNVTGGTVNVTIPSSAINFNINSSVPFWDMNISQAGAGAGNATVADQPNSAANGVANPVVAKPLVILNDLTLITGNTIALDVTTNTDQNLTVGGHFDIQAGNTYTSGTNTTTFNGSDNQVFTNNGTITAGLTDMTVNKTAGTLTIAGADLTVLDDFTLTQGTVADGGFTIFVAGDVVNYGTHSGVGRLELNGTIAQIISGSDGVFGNLYLNNATGADGSVSVTTTTNISLTGDLTFNQNNPISIGVYNLALSGTSDIIGENTTNRFIVTAGNASDGGLTKTYSASMLSFTYPIGTGATPDYTPASFALSAPPTAYGSVTIRPVASEHPLVSTTGRALTYYWKTTSSGFTLGAATVTHTYTYITGDVVTGGDVTEAGYVLARYNPSTSTWTKGDATDVDDAVNNIITTPASFNTTIDGEYTAGDDAATDPFTAMTYYSLEGGTFDWNDPNAWSTVSHTGAVAGSAPTSQSIVEIGDATYNNHVMVIDGNTAVCGELKIAAGCTLTVSTFTGHDFGIYVTPPSGNGTIRIASATVPAGDFGEFLGTSGGTYEYYGTTFTIPSSITNYYNLVVKPNAGAIITMPNVNLTVYNDMTTTQGGATGTTYLNTSATSRTLTINGDLSVLAGTLQYRNGSAQTLSVGGDVTVNGTFNVQVSAALTHSLTIGGSLANAGTLDLSTASSDCNVTFTGTANTSISGAGATTDFNVLTVNKGTSQSAVLEVSSNAFTLSGTSPTLVLTNGTFRLTSAVSITPATGAFTIPATACLSANGGTISVATTNTANPTVSDLFLNGKLEILAGTVNIGNSANSDGNDIEYASSGTPEIDVQGAGILNVCGQIRRPFTSTSGSLSFQLSGTSTVSILGLYQTVTTRASLEVCNAGSIFNMSGTSTLIFRNAFGVDFGDLYLRPASTAVTGGTIQFGNANTGAGEIFKINSDASLYNLTVFTTNSPTVRQDVYGLNLFNLTIQAGAVFNANSLDVTIGGDLTNSNITAATSVTTGGYRPGSVNQTTTFSSSTVNQTISGTATPNRTHFGKLVIDNTFGSVSLAANTAITVNKTLTLTNGTLADGGNTIIALSNVVNSATHTGAGSITLGSGGATDHTISGNGSGVFQNLTLNSTSGATMSANMTINGVLTFSQNALIYIDDNLLTLGESATVSGNNSSRYISTNGVLADGGLTKLYPASTLDFTFPIGVTGKYTPVRMNVTANAATGTINLRPVNSKHLLTTDALDKQLNYYWNVVSTGFSGLTLTHVYTYDVGDVTGTEASYLIGRNVSGTWTPIGGTAGVSSPDMTLTGVNYIDGDYTAGEASEFQAVPTYYSRNATSGGNWDDVNSWSTTSHAGGPVATAPTGQPIIIASGHTIVANGDSRSSSISVITGTLTLGNNVGHNLGTVSGTGTILLTPTGTSAFVFPAGIYTSFMSSSGGTIEYAGSSGVLPTTATYNNLTISGTGTKTMANTDISLNGNLIITGSAILSNSTYNKNIAISGDWTNNSASDFVPGTGTVTFNNTSADQVINGTKTTQTFYNLTLDKTAQTLSVGGSVTTLTVSNNFTHTSGNYTAPAALDIDDLNISGGTFTAGTTINISGNLTKSGGTFTQGGGTIIFDGANAQTITNNSAQTYNNITISNTSGDVTLATSGITIENTLDFTSGKLILGANNLIVGTAATSGTISGNSTSSYIATNSTGYLQRYVAAATETEFPIGTASYEDRVKLTPTNASTFQARVTDTPTISRANSAECVSLEWSIINSGGSPGSTTVDLGWDRTNQEGASFQTSDATVQVGGYQGSWLEIGGSYVENTPAGRSSVSAAGFTGFNIFGVGGGGGALPIELLYFDAKHNLGKVDLTWATASETNNDYFTVERTVDGINFDEIVHVKGAGNSSVVSNYSSVDADPLSGISYYRLKQTDFDGHYEYSKLVPVEVKGNFSFNIFPNPCNGEKLYISLPTDDNPEKEILILVYDIEGNELHAEVIKLSNQKSNMAAIDLLKKLTPGVYFIKAVYNQAFYNQKLIVNY